MAELRLVEESDFIVGSDWKVLVQLRLGRLSAPGCDVCSWAARLAAVALK